jgi:Holliday junction resolvase RusA-like endonuclease
LPFDRAARRDPSNYLPAVKALVDGLVDAELWPDDTPDYVSVAEPILKVGGQVEVRITVQ